DGQVVAEHLEPVSTPTRFAAMVAPSTRPYGDRTGRHPGLVIDHRAWARDRRATGPLRPRAAPGVACGIDGRVRRAAGTRSSNTGAVRPHGGEPRLSRRSTGVRPSPDRHLEPSPGPKLLRRFCRPG